MKVEAIDLYKQVFKPQTFPLHIHLVQEILPDRLDGLQTQSVDVGGCIISTQRGQVNKSDGLQQPSSLQDRRQVVTRDRPLPPFGLEPS